MAKDGTMVLQFRRIAEDEGWELDMDGSKNNGLFVDEWEMFDCFLTHCLDGEEYEKIREQSSYLNLYFESAEEGEWIKLNKGFEIIHPEFDFIDIGCCSSLLDPIPTGRFDVYVEYEEDA